MKGKAYKEKLDKIMNENPFTHLGDAVYSLLYKSIIRMDIPDDELLSDTIRLQDDGLIVKSTGQGFKLRSQLSKRMSAVI